MGNTIGSSFHGPDTKSFVIITLISIMSMAIYEAIYFFNKLKDSVRMEEQSRRIAVQAQLDTLRNQARPHFLFNSLNTLKDIIDHDPKEDAQNFVSQLSDVYRFILDSNNSDLTTLEKEIRFAKSYLYVQKERFGDNLKVNWNIEDLVLPKKLVSMSLQLLIENAIKHNVISKSLPLQIHIDVVDNVLIVKNDFQPKSTKIESTKLGLENIKNRYALLDAPIPEIIENHDQFIVKISLI